MRTFNETLEINLENIKTLEGLQLRQVEYIYLYIYICLYVCIFIYIYIHADV